MFTYYRIAHEKYIILEKIYSSHPEKIFEQTPILKDVLSNIDDQNRYQGVTLKNLEREGEYLERNVSCLIQDIIKCFEQVCGDLMDEAHEDATNTVKETAKVTVYYHTFANFAKQSYQCRRSNDEKAALLCQGNLRSILPNDYILGYFLSANKGWLS